jgi:hypothetical protein
MLRLNRYILALVLWISFFFNIERLDINNVEVVNVASPIYVLAVIMMVLGLLLPQMVHTKSWHLQVVTILVFIVVKLYGSRPIWGGPYTYLSLFEFSSLLISATLAHTIGRLSADFVETARALLFADTAGHVYAPENATLRIKHEMQYSRRTEHPLSVVVLETNTDQAHVTLHATAQEIQHLLVKRYSTVALTRLLAWRSRRTDFILDQNDQGQLILVAPGVGKDQIPTIISRLNEQAQQHLGITLRYGVATFPEEGVTFDELVYQAGRHLQSEDHEEHRRAIVDWSGAAGRPHVGEIGDSDPIIIPVRRSIP